MKVKALVTGHSKGLGLGIAKALSASGAEVMGVSRRLIEGGGPALVAQISLDLSDLQALGQWLQSADFADWWQGADQALLVNNAGVVTPVAPAGQQGPAEIASAVSLNVAAPLMLFDAFVKATCHCRERRAMHVSSGASRSAYAGWSVYCATKAALDHHARAVVMDSIPRLKVVSLAPGVIDTGMQGVIRAAGQELFPTHQRFVELKESGQLSDPSVAGASVCKYLLSDRYGEEVCADLRSVG